MVSIPAEKVRLHLTRSTRSGVIPEPILFVSARPGTGCADERVHFCVTFEPDGLFSRDTFEMMPSRAGERRLLIALGAGGASC